MKKIYIFILLLILNSLLFSKDDKIINLEKVLFKGLNINSSEYQVSDKDIDSNYSLAYSSLLPVGAIYSVKDIKTGKEAIVQIGYTQVNESPYNLYLPDNLYNFFSKGNNVLSGIDLQIKFLAWNKEGEASSYLNLHRFIVKPENSYVEVSKNGLDQYYIQLGAFSYYQNSYPIIYEMIPFLEIVPWFYLFKKDVVIKGELKEIYRILAGPYSLEDAQRISNNIQIEKNKKVLVFSAESIITQYGENEEIEGQ